MVKILLDIPDEKLNWAIEQLQIMHPNVKKELKKRGYDVWSKDGKVMITKCARASILHTLHCLFDDQAEYIKVDIGKSKEEKKNIYAKDVVKDVNPLVVSL